MNKKLIASALVAGLVLPSVTAFTQPQNAQAKLSELAKYKSDEAIKAAEGKVKDANDALMMLLKKEGYKDLEKKHQELLEDAKVKVNKFEEEVKNSETKVKEAEGKLALAQLNVGKYTSTTKPSYTDEDLQTELMKVAKAEKELADLKEKLDMDKDALTVAQGAFALVEKHKAKELAEIKAAKKAVEDATTELNLAYLERYKAELEASKADGNTEDLEKARDKAGKALGMLLESVGNFKAKLEEAEKELRKAEFDYSEAARKLAVSGAKVGDPEYVNLLGDAQYYKAVAQYNKKYVDELKEALAYVESKVPGLSDNYLTKLNAEYGLADTFTPGFAKKDGAWHYNKEDGTMAKGWVFDKGYNSWFYFDNDGKMAENTWRYVDGSWFFLNPGGYMAQNEWVKHTDGNWYYLKQGGYMAVNEYTPDGYLVDENGAWVK
ncbi:N-acetylmuramoyl-L-alanine amidase family protein [Gemella sp. zg-1178]|uniref:N-acetylmuramoyl-L-alanine amidase family protein n=1 Tax=Gemella sp. zg-1178 TaxID=2840372 RepID=UPI001C04D53A|nr:hypothetical protein [Gemella sp. zg-1178]MBU0278223.1 hypothetical protein [Gemella sp. zg-1178]